MFVGPAVVVLYSGRCLLITGPLESRVCSEARLFSVAIVAGVLPIGGQLTPAGRGSVPTAGAGVRLWPRAVPAQTGPGTQIVAGQL